MSLLKTIEADYIIAYKAKNEVKVAVLRMLKTAIKNKSVELKGDPDDDAVLDLITRQVKQHKDSIDQFSKAGRTDLADREKLELASLSEYMPSQLTDEELGAAIDALIASTGAASMADMGKVMGALSAQYKGRIDGKKASDLVRLKLTP
ncbi:MAG: GatB/YqeY domain-containing protein [Proteobacteria bacterium]|nr:GatB/YqeY domain-containing protein [Pseudomonadota bacterium]MBU1610676.1 GatB/YqeY domain-containing protein [Pseudomonadota bacterium]